GRCAPEERTALGGSNRNPRRGSLKGLASRGTTSLRRGAMFTPHSRKDVHARVPGLEFATDQQPMTPPGERSSRRRWALGLGLASAGAARAGAGLLSFRAPAPTPQDGFAPQRRDLPGPPAWAGRARPVQEVRDTLAPGEQVLGVKAGGQARA